MTYASIQSRLAILEATWPKRKTFNARVIADVLGVKYPDLLAMVRCGVFPAWKTSNCWEIPIRGNGSPVDWSEHRRYDTSRRFQAGHVPMEELLKEME